MILISRNYYNLLTVVSMITQRSVILLHNVEMFLLSLHVKVISLFHLLFTQQNLEVNGGIQ